MSEIKFLNFPSSPNFLAENKDWTVDINDIGNDNLKKSDKSQSSIKNTTRTAQLSLHVKILDMFSHTSFPEFKTYPFCVSISIVATYPNKSYYNYSYDDYNNRLQNHSEVIRRKGGIAVDDLFYLKTIPDSEENKKLETDKMKNRVCTIDKGSLYNRYNKKFTLIHPQFKTIELALDYSKDLILKHANEIMKDSTNILSMKCHTPFTGIEVLKSHLIGEKV